MTFRPAATRAGGVHARPRQRERLRSSSTARASRSPTAPRRALGTPTAGAGPAGARHALGRRAGDVQRDRQRRHPPRRDRRRDRRGQPVGRRLRGLQLDARPRRTRAATSPGRARAPTSRTRRSRPRPAIAGKRTLLLRVTDAAGNQTVSAPFAVTARGPVNGAGGGDGARLVAGFPGHTFRGRGKARRRVGVLRPTKTVGWGHSAPVRGILRNAAGQPVAGAELRLLVRELRLGAHYRRSRRGHHRRRRPLQVPDPARLLAALPDRLPRLRGRRGAHRQVRRHLQHQGADHRPRARATSRSRGSRALPRPPRRPPAAAARRDARAPGPPAGPRLADGQDHPHAQGRRVLDALPLQFRRRPLHVPHPPATERQLSLRARDEQPPRVSVG